MQKINTPRILLSAALMGTFAIAPLMAPQAQADPPRNAPAYGRRDKDKKDKKDKKYDSRRDDKRDRYDRDRYDRDRYDRDRDYRDRYDRDSRNNRNNATFSGTVTNVRSGNSFDLRANGRTYNVYLSSSLPRGLNRGDEVRVYGRPYGDNDIRNASVRITDNNNRDDPRRDDRNDNYGSRQTVSGVVTNYRSDRQFDLRVGSRTYNVYASSSTRGLSNGDLVRVYGQRYGDNDIRNASVTITRNDRDNNNGSYGSYRTYSGVVTSVKNSREFDVRVDGRTYNVYANNSTSGLDRGDEVRVYGQRYGDNDLRNASVRITRNR